MTESSGVGPTPPRHGATRRKNLIYAQVVRTSLSGFLLVCLPGARRMRLVLSFVISLLYALAIADGCVEINQCVGMIQHECAVKFDFHTGRRRAFPVASGEHGRSHVVVFRHVDVLHGALLHAEDAQARAAPHRVGCSAEINQCVRPAWRYYLLFWQPRCSTRVLGVLARGVVGLLTRTFDFRTGPGCFLFCGRRGSAARPGLSY